MSGSATLRYCGHRARTRSPCPKLLRSSLPFAMPRYALWTIQSRFPRPLATAAGRGGRSGTGDGCRQLRRLERCDGVQPVPVAKDEWRAFRDAAAFFAASLALLL